MQTIYVAYGTTLHYLAKTAYITKQKIVKRKRRERKMAIAKKGAAKKAAEENTINYEVKVTRVKEFESGDIGCDLVVNGVSIYGCVYKSVTRFDGSEYSFISFPARKGSDDKYYNHAFFKISDELLKKIEDQIESLL